MTTVDKIKKIAEDNPHLQLQEQFGTNDKLITLTIRYSNSRYSSPTDYLTALPVFHRILKEAIPVKVSLSTTLELYFFMVKKKLNTTFNLTSMLFYLKVKAWKC
jgi:hypothetical protein